MKNELLTKRIKELRKAHRFTQDYVASALNISRQTYSHYETGRRAPSSEILFQLAGIYNISVDDLLQISLDIDRNVHFDAPAPTSSSKDLELFLEHLNNPDNQKKYLMLSKYEKELIFYFDKLSDYDKKEIIEIIKLKLKLNSQNTQ